MSQTNNELFADIRPYHDAEVAPVLAGILSDDEFIHAICRFRYPRLSRWAGWLLKPVVRYVLQQRARSITSVRAFQQIVERYMQHMIDTTTDGVTYSGLENLTPGESYLFISNHRDIAMDPALVNWGLYHNGHDTVRIAIGDNLLRKPYASDIMRLNKSFIVKRSAKGVREMLAAFTELSAYIRHSLDEKQSIWIAQKEGRAKDGNDQTDPAILKMFYMNGKKQQISMADYFRSLNIVPVAISYEYDAGEVEKAAELAQKARGETYVKAEFEDLDSIVKGIVGYKGRVQVSFGPVMREEMNSPEELAAWIDQHITEQYHLFPSNLLAAGICDEISVEKQQEFAMRMSQVPAELRERVERCYALPACKQHGLPLPPEPHDESAA
ncbi:1-acyl-sn-glycerol-3-phosphate acyltransferase [Plesiomonas shigelloides]|jgi:1-acyl-sn-glycerol-3-phosphate acyltransferase